MADTFGAATLPLATPVTGEAAGDPGLTRIVNYLQAWLNARDLGAFHAVVPAGQSAVIVNKAYTHDPAQFLLNEKDLPSLYLFRTGGRQVEWLAEDWDISHDTLQLYWVLADREQNFQRLRTTLASGLHKEIYHAIETGRHPAYVLAGDTDPKAATLGSLLYTAANVFAIDVGTWDVGKLNVQMTDGKPAQFDRVGIKLELQERRFLDIVADYPPNTGTGGLDFTLTTPDKARDLVVGKV